VELNICSGSQLIVLGDLHGQLHDIFTVLSKYGLPAQQTLYLFNGDFVDRGEYSCEVTIFFEISLP